MGSGANEIGWTAKGHTGWLKRMREAGLSEKVPEESVTEESDDADDE